MGQVEFQVALRSRWERLHRELQVKEVLSKEVVSQIELELPLPRPKSAVISQEERVAIAYLVWQEGINTVDGLLLKCYGLKKGTATHTYDKAICGKLSERVKRIRDEVEAIAERERQEKSRMQIEETYSNIGGSLIDDADRERLALLDKEIALKDMLLKKICELSQFLSGNADSAETLNLISQKLKEVELMAGESISRKCRK